MELWELSKLPVEFLMDISLVSMNIRVLQKKIMILEPVSLHL
jgi:hypothetical protein